MRSLLFLFLLTTALLSAQPTATITNEHNADDVLSPVFELLNLDDVSTGLLKERSVNWINLDQLDGTSINDDNILNLDAFGLSYFSLSGMSIGGGAALPDPLDVYTLPSEELDIQNDTIPIVSLFYDYHAIREDAITANLLVWQNNQLIDVVDRIESPYLQKQLFAASALRNRLPIGIYSFDLSSAMFFTNKTADINSIAIDFDDGQGYQAVASNQTFVVDYSIDGDKDVKLRIELQDGSFAYSHFSIVIFENNAAKTISNGEVDTILLVPPTSFHSGGSLHVFFNCDEKLTKPLIIMDGLDPDAREDLGRTEEDLRTVDFVVNLLRFPDPVSSTLLIDLVA